MPKKYKITAVIESTTPYTEDEHSKKILIEELGEWFTYGDDEVKSIEIEEVKE